MEYAENVNIENGANSIPPRNICKKHLDSGKCEIKDCCERHPEVCKYWNKSSGCNGWKRNTEWYFLHGDLAKTSGKVDIEDKQDVI